MDSQGLKMEYVNLGQSGLKISKIVLGAMQFGTKAWQEWVLDEDESLELLEHAYKVGIRTWDTADVYSHGRSEEIIGKALTKYSIPRERVVILTKCFFGVDESGAQPQMGAVAANAGENINQVGLSRKHIIDAVDRSVRRLGTYIDVLQIHRLDRETPKTEIMRALNDVVESGKVRYIGASSMAAWEFQMLQNIAHKHGWHQFISMQSHYNLLYREEEREMFPYCNETGVGLIPWSPLARGALCRPWGERDTKRENTDAYLKAMIRSRETDADKAVIDRVAEISKKRGVSMTTITIAWCLSKGTCPIIGLGSKGRIDEACEGIKYKISQDDVEYLEAPYVSKGRAHY